jgi:hypothetical protein
VKILVVLMEALAVAAYVVRILMFVAGTSAAWKGLFAVKTILVVMLVVEVLVVRMEILVLGESAVQMTMFAAETPAV